MRRDVYFDINTFHFNIYIYIYIYIVTALVRKITTVQLTTENNQNKTWRNVKLI